MMNRNANIYKNDPFELCRSYNCNPTGNDLIILDEDLRVKSGVYLLDNALDNMKKVVNDSKNIYEPDNSYNSQSYFYNNTNEEEGFEDKITTKFSIEREIELQPDKIQKQQMKPKKISPNNFLIPTYEQSTQQYNLGKYRQYSQQKPILQPSNENPFSVEKNAKFRPARFPNFLDEANNYIQPSQMMKQSKTGSLQNPPLPSQWNPLSDDSTIYKSQIKNDMMKTIKYDKTNDMSFLKDKQKKGNWISPVASQLDNLQFTPTDISNLSVNPISQTFNKNQKQTQKQLQQTLNPVPQFKYNGISPTNPNTSLPNSSIENFEEYSQIDTNNGNILPVETRCQYQKKKVIQNKNGNPNISYHSYMDLPTDTFIPPKNENKLLKQFDEYSKDSDLILKDRNLRRKAGMDNLNREMSLLTFDNIYSPHIPSL